jgi:diadenosine tetraphosphate (Ap4A) HIT family hydrolase
MTDLHPQLQKDCLILGRFELSHLLLLNDSNYPWFILVPDRADITEVYELSDQDRNQLWLESHVLSAHIMLQFGGDKLNIGAIGNLVPQLHLHHIVRYRSDLAWPAPVWGKTAARPYSDEALTNRIEMLNLSGLTDFRQI